MAESSRTCRQCGTPNPPGNNFCGRCGTYLAPTPAPAPPRLRAVPTADEARNRRNVAIINAIAAFFILSCLILFAVVIIWRP